jgi:hypothetical protein
MGSQPPSASFPPGEPRVAHLDCGQSFVVNDLQKGSLEGPSRDGPSNAAVYFNVFKMGSAATFIVPFGCTAKDAPTGFPSNVELGVKLPDSVLGAKLINGKWIPVAARERYCDIDLIPKRKRKDIDENLPCFYPNEHFKVFSLEGNNWKGTGTLLDMTTGEPKTRQREFSYCLIPDSVATRPFAAACMSAI